MYTRLYQLFNPKTVAVIGATDRPGSFGHYCSKHLQESPGVEKTFYINPGKKELFGERAYASLHELDQIPECVALATPAEVVLPLLQDAAELGVKNAVIFSSGFAEIADGKAREKELAELSDRYDMNIIGPNCLGFINNVGKVKIWGTVDQVDMSTRKTGIAILAQSGGTVNGIMSRAYIDFSYGISCGNGAAMGIESLMEFCVEDSAVTALAVYMEGVRRPAVFMEALRKAAEHRKPVIIYKTGRSAKGAASATSHTGSMAGATEIFDSVFKKYGVIQVDSFEELVCVTQMVSILGNRMPKENGFGLMALSGGEATGNTDLCDAYGIQLPDITPATAEKLRDLIPFYGVPKNPLDMTSDVLGDKKRTQAIIEAMGDDPNIHCLIGGFSFSDGGGSGLSFDFNSFVGEPIIAYEQREGAVPMICIAQNERRCSPEWQQRLKEHGVVLASCSELGFKSVGKLKKYIGYDKARFRLEPAAPDFPGKSEEAGVALSEFDSKEELAAAGVPIPRQAIARSVDELPGLLAEMRWPVVLKINSPDILHKTDAGGVALNICDEAAAHEAFERILSSCKAYAPDARVDGILVQEMRPKGVEILLGVKCDPMFGPFLMVGMGGVFVEVFRDVALNPCPVSHEEAKDMLSSLRAYKLLEGYRGSAPCDVDSLCDLMVQVSEYARNNAHRLRELDMNPVFVYEKGKGVCAVDALIVNNP